MDDPREKAGELKSTFDFADELIAFDKMEELIPKQKGDELDDARLLRLQSILKTLKEGLTRYHDQVARVLIDKAQKNEMEAQLKAAKTFTFSKDAFAETQSLFDKEMAFFTNLIKAYRMAKLEVEEVYDASIHDGYFACFHWHRFLPEELALFPPILLIITHRYLYDHLTTFSRLLASNQPITVLVLNHQVISEPNEGVSWEDASHQNRQELAALTLSYRRVYFAQTGLDTPALFHQALTDALKGNGPAVCQVSVPNTFSEAEAQDVLKAHAAAAGRYFPKISYHPDGAFDASKNLQADQTWPQLELKAKTSDETEATMEVAFTYADYKAIFPEKAGELLPIPSRFYDELLIPLGEYLQLEEEQLYRMIPYIWLVSDANELYRAAVPYVWVVSCQERRQFWSYLQNLNAAKSPSPEVTVSVSTLAIAQLSEQQLAQIQEQAMTQATERLIAVLLEEM